MKNNISAKKLSLYFATVLLVFALVIGFIFFSLHKKQAIDIQENLLIDRAKTIAKEIENLNFNKGQMSGYGSYLSSINSIAGADAWIVDENMDITTSHSRMHSQGHGNSSSGMGQGMGLGMGQGRGIMRHMEDDSDGHMEENVIDNTNTDLEEKSTFIELPKNAEKVINKILSGEVEVNNAFSEILGEKTITVGVPIKTEDGEPKQAVLLHSSIKGVDDAVKQGVNVLFISLLIGLAIAILLSIYLSRVFTGPILLEEAEKIIKMEDDRKNFLAQIAHELKTPITVMKSTLENFDIKDEATVEELRENNNIVLDEVNSLQRLVGDLLDLSKLEATDFSMEISEVIIPDLISDVIRSCRKIAKVKNIEIIQKNIPSIAIEGDYVRLRQMFLIVMDNGIKFSDNNSSIEIIGHVNSISICDNGVGMSKEEISHIFKRFYKSNGKNNEKGTGLGLPIAKEIAKRHEITMTVESEIGKGTCFNFIFSKIDNI